VSIAEKDPLMVDAYTGAYIIQLNVDSWGDQLAGSDFDYPYIPVFFAIDETGRATGEVIDGGAWSANIPENMAPALKEFFQKAGN